MMKHALTTFQSIAALMEFRSPVICLDYDGTLTPVQADPRQTFLSETMHHTLLQLSKHYPMLVISGRQLANVKELVGIDRIYYAGNHGFELCGPHGQDYIRFTNQDHVEAIDQVYQVLDNALGHIQGIYIEHKTLTLSVHYGRAPEYKNKAQAIIQDVLADYPQLAEHTGKNVYEIRPNMDWHKGKAVVYFIENLGKPVNRLLPMYIGDDLTDEDAFGALQAYTSIRILVSAEPRDSRADYYLSDVGEVAHYLHSLTQVR